MGARFSCSFYVPMQNYSETDLYKKAEDFYAAKGHKLIAKEGKFLIFDYDMEWGSC